MSRFFAVALAVGLVCAAGTTALAYPRDPSPYPLLENAAASVTLGCELAVVAADDWDLADDDAKLACDYPPYKGGYPLADYPPYKGGYPLLADYPPYKGGYPLASLPL